MPVIKTRTGNVNLRTSSGKCYLFHSPTDGGREVFIDSASPEAGIKKLGKPSYFAAIKGRKPDISGRFIEQKFYVRQGEVLKLFITVNPGLGKMELSGSVFLRVRKSAACRRLHIDLTNNYDASFRDATIEGTFDIISVEDAVKLGCKVPKAFFALASSTMRRKLLTKDDILLQEESPPPLIVEKTLEDKKVVVSKRRRSIEL